MGDPSLDATLRAEIAGVFIRPATGTDRPSIVALLEEVTLPTQDLWMADHTLFLVAERDGKIVGCAGAELSENVALLRSLAVRDHWRRTGIGGRLIATLEAACRTSGTCQAYLLTQTAEVFFSRRGYSRTDRATAPPAIAASTEFSSVCPASAAFMSKTLWPLGPL
jgi:amino-acid N-acetyltransferase